MERGQSDESEGRMKVFLRAMLILEWALLLIFLFSCPTFPMLSRSLILFFILLN
jgi:hypothetical protein